MEICKNCDHTRPLQILCGLGAYKATGVWGLMQKVPGFD